MLAARPSRTLWAVFPDVVILAPETAVKGHSAYAHAKAGDVEAAYSLVAEVLGDGVVQVKIPRIDDRPTLVAAHAVEREGINRIPTALAGALAARLGLPAEDRIVQINTVTHTGASGWHRLAFPALFDGPVERGRVYVLVDDFVGQGGTLANLRGFVETRGGQCLGAVTLTGKAYSARLALDPATLNGLRHKHGRSLEDWWTAQFGYGFDCLTESEARYLARAEDAELVRDRIAAARQAVDA